MSKKRDQPSIALLFLTVFFLFLFSSTGNTAPEKKGLKPRIIPSSLQKRFVLPRQHLEESILQNTDPLTKGILESFSLKKVVYQDPYLFTPKQGFLPPPSSYIVKKNLHLLISDTYNHRLIEVDKYRNILWQYGWTGVMGSQSGFLHYPSFAEPQENGDILVTDLANDRILLLRDNQIIWQYGTTLVEGDGANELFLAETATRLQDGTILITDTSNHRVVAVDSQKRVVWQYGSGYKGRGVNELDSPQGSYEAAGGRIIIADTGNHRVILVDRAKKILWQYGKTHKAGSQENELNLPNMATELFNGNVLIVDSGNHRVIEVEPKSKRIVWQYGATGKEGSGFNELRWPYNAYRLFNGNTLITDSDNHRIIEVDPYHRIVWQYGKTGQKGDRFNELDAPYDAHWIFSYEERSEAEPLVIQLPWFSTFKEMEEVIHDKIHWPLSSLSVSVGALLEDLMAGGSQFEWLEKQYQKPFPLDNSIDLKSPDLKEHFSLEGPIEMALMEEKLTLTADQLWKDVNLWNRLRIPLGKIQQKSWEIPFYFQSSFSIHPSSLESYLLFSRLGDLEAYERELRKFYLEEIIPLKPGMLLEMLQVALAARTPLEEAQKKLKELSFSKSPFSLQKQEPFIPLAAYTLAQVKIDSMHQRKDKPKTANRTMKKEKSSKKKGILIFPPPR